MKNKVKSIEEAFFGDNGDLGYIIMTENKISIETIPKLAAAIESVLNEGIKNEEAKELADKIWNETVGKEELMYNSVTQRVHKKTDVCEAVGCIKYDEKTINHVKIR